MKFRYIYLQTHLSKRVFFKLYIIRKDLTPRVFPLFIQCLPLYHCATLKHMIIGQSFWYLKLLFFIQTWQIYMNFRYIYLQTHLSKRVERPDPKGLSTFQSVHLFLAAQGIRTHVFQQTEQNLTQNGLYNLKVSSPKNNITNSA